MRDSEAIQGLWRIVSKTSNRKPVGTGATHCLFRDGYRKEIWPSVVDTGNLKVAYGLDDQADPKTITFNYYYAKTGVFPDAPNFVQRGYYRLDGEGLQICWGYVGDFPAEFSDEFTVDAFQRDHGPIPETRKPSGKQPLQDELLGTLDWDDNINYYHGEITVNSKPVSIGLYERDGDAAPLLIRAKKIVANIDYYADAAKQYAADRLLDLGNDWVYDAEQRTLTSEEFLARIGLESISVDSEGRVTFGHNDGGIFWGHWVSVQMDSNDDFYDAKMEG